MVSSQNHVGGTQCIKTFHPSFILNLKDMIGIGSSHSQTANTIILRQLRQNPRMMPGKLTKKKVIDVILPCGYDQ
jgi:hypothetical protein